MDMTTSLIGSIQDMKSAEISAEANVKVMKKALDIQEQVGESVLKLLESGDVNRAQAGQPTGSNIDLYA